MLDSFFDDHFGAHDNSSQSSQSQPQIPPTPEVFDDGESSDDDLGSNDDDDENVNDIVNRFVQNQDQDAQDQEEEPYYNVNDLPNLKLNEACGCSNECFKKFPSQEVVDHIWMIRSLDKNEKEMQIMTLLKTFGIDSSTTRRGDRKRTVYQYRFSDKKVCRSAFMVFYDIHDFTLRSLISHIHEHGVSTRIHGNTGKKAKHALVFDDVKRVVKFLDSYASEHGLPQPAAPRGRPDIPPIYLHSSLTKTSVHKIYVDSLSNEDVRVVKITAFCEIWKSCVPHIQIASPRLDVCATCETSRKQVMDAVSEQAKLDATNSVRDHLLTAQNERELYMSMIRRSQDNNGDQNNFVHYTFDFAQNVTLPHHARQMGPLYFLSLKKVRINTLSNKKHSRLQY